MIAWFKDDHLHVHLGLHLLIAPQVCHSLTSYSSDTAGEVLAVQGGQYMDIFTRRSGKMDGQRKKSLYVKTAPLWSFVNLHTCLKGYPRIFTFDLADT